MPGSRPGRAWGRHGPGRGQAKARGTLTKQQGSCCHECGGMVQDGRSVCRDQIVPPSLPSVASYTLRWWKAHGDIYAEE